MLLKRTNVVRRIGAALSAVAVVSAIIGLHEGAVPSVHAATSGLTFSKLTDHPYASQSGYLQGDGSISPAGRNIWNMAITSDGKLIAGYGDYNGNSDSWGITAGRVGVVPYDIATNTWGSITYAGSEAIQTIRQINGALYIPTIDPSIYGVGGYLTNKSGAWQRITTVPSAVHIYDIATSNGSDLLLFGAEDPGGVSTATVWRSTDDGVTWSVVMTDTNFPNQNGFERYYWGLNLNGNVYTQASNIYTTVPTRVLSSTTGLWSNANSAQFDGGDVDSGVFDGKIIRSKIGGLISTFDGTSAGTVTYAAVNEGATRNFYVDSGYLYVLNDSAVYRTRSLAGPWQRLGSVPTNMRSLAVYDDKIYLGDNVGSIWRSDTTITASVLSFDACFEIFGGIIVDYYTYQNNDSANPACPSQVVVPDSIGGATVIGIGDEAFAGAGLSSVVLGSGVTNIGKGAFRNNSLTSLTIPNSVTYIDTGAFMNNKLANLTLGSGLTMIGNQAFMQNSLMSVAIPDLVTIIGNEAFRGNKLTSLQLNNQVESIGTCAFGYNRLSSLTIPASVSSIGENVDLPGPYGVKMCGSFEGNYISSLTLSGPNIIVTGSAFALNKLTSVTIPTGVVSLSSDAFILQNPRGVDMIKDNGFSTMNDFLQTSSTGIKSSLDTVWYAQLHTQDPANPKHLQDGVYVSSLTTNKASYGGHLINPVNVTLAYVDSSGKTIRPSDTYVGSGLRSYLVGDNPYDNRSATARTTALARYYRLGGNVIITAPIISGYALAEPTYSTVLGRSTTLAKFVYTTKKKLLPSGSSRLNNSGMDMLPIIGSAVGLLSLGVIIALRLSSKAL